jgi:hypothetical protein
VQRGQLRRDEVRLVAHVAKAVARGHGEPRRIVEAWLEEGTLPVHLEDRDEGVPVRHRAPPIEAHGAQPTPTSSAVPTSSENQSGHAFGRAPGSVAFPAVSLTVAWTWRRRARSLWALRLTGAEGDLECLVLRGITERVVRPHHLVQPELVGDEQARLQAARQHGLESIGVVTVSTSRVVRVTLRSQSFSSLSVTLFP